jgi:hypothetical protein
MPVEKKDLSATIRVSDELIRKAKKELDEFIKPMVDTNSMKTAKANEQRLHKAIGFIYRADEIIFKSAPMREGETPKPKKTKGD